MNLTLINVISWNDRQMEKCYSELKKVKNNLRREELHRNANRFARNIINIRKRAYPEDFGG